MFGLIDLSDGATTRHYPVTGILPNGTDRNCTNPPAGSVAGLRLQHFKVASVQGVKAPGNKRLASFAIRMLPTADLPQGGIAVASYTFACTDNMLGDSTDLDRVGSLVYSFLAATTTYAGWRAGEF